MARIVSEQHPAHTHAENKVAGKTPRGSQECGWGFAWTFHWTEAELLFVWLVSNKLSSLSFPPVQLVYVFPSISLQQLCLRIWKYLKIDIKIKIIFKLFHILTAFYYSTFSEQTNLFKIPFGVKIAKLISLSRETSKWKPKQAEDALESALQITRMILDGCNQEPSDPRPETAEVRRADFIILMAISKLSSIIFLLSVSQFLCGSCSSNFIVGMLSSN